LQLIFFILFQEIFEWGSPNTDDETKKPNVGEKSLAEDRRFWPEKRCTDEGTAGGFAHFPLDVHVGEKGPGPDSVVRIIVYSSVYSSKI
jgi:hypothetical protein